MVSTYELTVDGKTYVVEVGDLASSPVEVVVNGKRRTVTFCEAREAAPPGKAEPAPQATAPAPEPKSQPGPKPQPELVAEVTPPSAVSGTAVRAPMPGKILSICVSEGDPVSDNDTVCTLEAMKMEMPISAGTAGTVKGVHVKVGDNVAHNDPLVTIG